MKKPKVDISTMFLVPKRIYFAMRNSIGYEDKLNQLDRLNMGTNYIEKAIQFRQQKSFKSQPEASKKIVSTLADTSSLNTTTMNNNKQTAPATNISIPARINEEPAQDSITSVSPLPASPLDGHDFIFPTVSQPVQRNWKSATANNRSTTGNGNWTRKFT